MTTESDLQPSVELEPVEGGGSTLTGGGGKEAKGDVVTLVHTEQEWERLVHTLGLVVIDIFSTWCGPCTAMDFHLKRLKMKSVMTDDKVRSGDQLIAECYLFPSRLNDCFTLCLIFPCTQS